MCWRQTPKKRPDPILRTFCRVHIWKWLNSPCSTPTFQPSISQDGFLFGFSRNPPNQQSSFILHYTDYIGVCPEEFHSLSIFKAWNLLAGLSPRHTSSSAIYIQETVVEEATVDHLFMKSKLCGNKLSTLKQLRVRTPKLNISSQVFFKVRSKGENDTGHAKKKKRKEKRGHCRWCKIPV